MREPPVRVAAHPRLYDPLPDVPVLNGTRCARCGRVYFPPIGVGCEICGAPAEDLLPTTVAATGAIHALAQVHLHPGAPETPFTIAEIALDAGPLIRAMVHPESPPLSIGVPVTARWSTVGVDDAGAAIVEPAFAVDQNRASS
jgi:hypothetical protein